VDCIHLTLKIIAQPKTGRFYKIDLNSQFNGGEKVIDEKAASELVDSVFTFDYVGDSMMAVRKNLDDVELQKVMIQELATAALSKLSDTSAESVEIITKAAEERVAIYVRGSKAAKGKGCG
jgi:hypothetical protein